MCILLQHRRDVELGYELSPRWHSTTTSLGNDCSLVNPSSNYTPRCNKDTHHSRDEQEPNFTEQRKVFSIRNIGADILSDDEDTSRQRVVARPGSLLTGSSSKTLLQSTRTIPLESSSAATLGSSQQGASVTGMSSNNAIPRNQPNYHYHPPEIQREGGFEPMNTSSTDTPTHLSITTLAHRTAMSLKGGRAGPMWSHSHAGGEARLRNVPSHSGAAKSETNSMEYFEDPTSTSAAAFSVLWYLQQQKECEKTTQNHQGTGPGIQSIFSPDTSVLEARRLQAAQSSYAHTHLTRKAHPNYMIATIANENSGMVNGRFRLENLRGNINAFLNIDEPSSNVVESPRPPTSARASALEASTSPTSKSPGSGQDVSPKFPPRTLPAI